jgi:hypothetical protein
MPAPGFPRKSPALNVACTDFVQSRAAESRETDMDALAQAVFAALDAPAVAELK